MSKSKRRRRERERRKKLAKEIRAHLCESCEELIYEADKAYCNACERKKHAENCNCDSCELDRWLKGRNGVHDKDCNCNSCWNKKLMGSPPGDDGMAGQFRPSKRRKHKERWLKKAETDEVLEICLANIL